MVIILGGILWSAVARPVFRSIAKPAMAAGLEPVVATRTLGLGFLMCLGFVMGRVSPDSHRDPAHQRGTYIEAAPNRRHRRAKPGQLTLAGIPIDPLDETKLFKMIGTTGTGKSTAIRELLGAALARGDRAVIADPDGGYVKTFYDPKRGDIISNPFDERSHKWDLLSEIRHEYDFEQLARSLIPEGHGQDRNWRLYGQILLAEVMRQSQRAGVTDTGEIHRLLTSATPEQMRSILQSTTAQPFLEVGNERMFGSIRSVTSSALTALSFIDRQTTPLFSVRNWVKSGKGVLFLPYQADQIAALRNVISTWMRIAIFEKMTHEEGGPKLWFTIDELDALGQIDGLKDALARLRKFGGCCILGFQSIAQVSGLYGDAEAQTIVENCGNTLILRCSASQLGGTAQFASRLIGEREIIRKQVTRNRNAGWFDKPHSSVSRSDQHFTELAVLASQIEQLPDLTGCLKLASRPDWLKIQMCHS